MPDRLDKLTPEQEALLPAIRDEWLAHGLSTQPADRATAVEGVNEAYAAAGLKPPKLVIWLDSPMGGAIGSAMLQRAQVWAQVGDQVRDQVWAQVGAQVWAQVRAQVGDQVRAQVWAQVRDQVWAQVRDQVGDQVRAQVGAQVGDQVWAQVRDQVGDQVRAQVWAQVRDQVGDQVRAQVWAQVGAQVRDQVRDQVWAQVRAQVGDQVHRAGWGQHEASWLSFYDSFARFGIKAAERLCGLNKIGKSSGWWWPMEGAVVLTERPRELHRDDEGRLHNENGPAIVYPDGWGIWAVHGVRVTQQIVESPEMLTAKDVQEEENAEVRRVMVDRMGADRYLRESDASLVDEDAEWGKLWRLDQEDDEPIVMVECINSTPEPDGTSKTYWLRVPPEMRTARAALGWTFDVSEKDYALDAQS